MDHRGRFLVLAMGAAALAGTSWAGSLEPPPGPVTPTMKPLDVVEARIPIRQSDLPLNIYADGSYYLAENLNANQNGVDMITVTATTVSIDLNGFTIHGTSQIAQSDDCITVEPSVRSFAVSNGFIRGCGGTGVTAIGDMTVSVTRVHATNNVEGLVFGLGTTGVISECVARGNTGRGIVLARGVVENSMTFANGWIGLTVSSGLVRGCVSRDNGGLNLGTMVSGLVIDTYAP